MAQQFIRSTYDVGSFTYADADALVHDLSELYTTVGFGVSPTTQVIKPSASPDDRTPILGPAVGGLNAWEGTILQEPNTWYFGGYWHTLYTGGPGAQQSIGYAYATSPTGPWIKPNPNPVIGNGAGGLTAGQYCTHTGMYIEGGTVYLVTSQYPNTGSVLLFSAPLNFTVATGPTFTLVGSIYSRPAGINSWGNFALTRNPFAPGYILFTEGLVNSNQAYEIGAATTSAASLSGAPAFTNSVTTISSLITGMGYYGAAAILTGGPWVTIENGTLVMFYHGGPRGNSPPTDVFRAVCTDPTLNTWVNDNNGYPVMRRLAMQEVDQTADPSFALGPSGWWCFTTAYDNRSGISNVLATPCLTTVEDGFSDRGFNGTVTPAATITTYAANNGDNLLFNAGLNFTTVTLPKSSIGSFVRIGCFNGATSKNVAVVAQGTDVILGGQRVLPGQLVTYRSDNPGFWCCDAPPQGGSYQYSVPTTAFSITCLSFANKLLLEPAGTLATGTIVFPNSPADGQEQSVSSTQAVTAVTFTPGSGDTIVGAPAGLAANAGIAFKYRQALNKWYRLY